MKTTQRKRRATLERTSRVICASFCVAIVPVAYAAAQDVAKPTVPATAPDAAAPTADDAPKSFWEQSQLLGDMAGLRTFLGEHGTTFTLQEIDDGIANLRGGIHTGTVYEGQTEATLLVDTEKAFQLPGGSFFVSAYQIHGRSPTQNLVGSQQLVTSIDATDSTRLYELWYEQKFLGDALSVRLGQLGVDSEFLINKYGTTFVNSTFGFPGLTAVDLPSGGAAYPLATPGIRVKYVPSEALTFLAGLYNGNPAPNGTGDPQVLDPSGTTFRLNGGAFVIAEAQYYVNPGDNPAGLPGVYKIGAWLNTNRFNDQQYDTAGVSLASPQSNGMPKEHLNNWSAYALFDQLVWLREGTTDQGIGVFGRIMGAPGDRNLSNFYVNGGLNWKGIIPSRGDDTFGLGAGYLGISPSAQSFDRATAFYAGTPYPIRSNEIVIEAMYQAQVTGWATAQPFAQYYVRPGGNVPNPAVPGAVIKNSFVLGLRTTVTF
jgi:porin